MTKLIKAAGCEDEEYGRGGKRKGAGRKRVYDEPRKQVRVPVSLLADFRAWLAERVGK